MSVSDQELLLDKLKNEIEELSKQKAKKLEEHIVENTTDKDAVEFYKVYELKIFEAQAQLNSKTKTLSLEERIKISEDIKLYLEQQLLAFDIMEAAPKSRKPEEVNELDFREAAPQSKKPEEMKIKLEQEQTGHPIITTLMKALRSVGAGLRLIASPFIAVGSWIIDGITNLVSTGKNKKQKKSIESQNINVNSSLATSEMGEKIKNLGGELKSITKQNVNPLIHTPTTSDPQVIIHTPLESEAPEDSTQPHPSDPNTEEGKPNKDPNPTV